MSNTRKLPARYNAVIMPLLLSLFMSGVVSGVSTVRAVGLAPDVLSQWAKA